MPLSEAAQIIRVHGLKAAFDQLVDSNCLLDASYLTPRELVSFFRKLHFAMIDRQKLQPAYADVPTYIVFSHTLEKMLNRSVKQQRM